MKKNIRINEQITASEIRVVDEKEGNLGVLSRDEALAKASARDLDLIEISPTAIPPVAKIMDFGKYQYQQKQKAKEAKSKIHLTETKSIQIKIGTGENDLKLKASKVNKFLTEGHRVKVELFLPGRSKYLNQEFLRDRLNRFLEIISVDFKIAENIKKNPKGLVMIIEKDNKNK